jgi:tight adherence protein C
VLQAEQLGVSISQVLRVQADQLRTRRRQKAEKSAREAAIKMLFPLVLFIFPAFMLVILGPAGIRLTETLGGF